MIYKKHDLVTFKLTDKMASILSNMPADCETIAAITSHESAPFDWNNIEWGMAFKNNHYSLFYYVGVDIQGMKIFDFKDCPEHQTSQYSSFGFGDCLDHAGLVRVPEKDITPKKFI